MDRTSPPSLPPAPDPAAAAAVLPMLTQQLHRFFHLMDARGYDGMLALFADDCRWLRQGAWLEGKDAVRAALEARPAAIGTRHVLTNAHVAALGTDAPGTERAVLEAYMTAYRHAAPSEEGVVPQSHGPLRLNLVTTVFLRAPDADWRIAEQRMVPALAFPEAPR